MKVGVVQYFIKHYVRFVCEQTIVKVQHVFAYVKWKTMHPNYNHFGRSATVCVNMFESPGVCSLLPAQRIACHAAHAVMPVDFGHLKENVFIACPILVKFHL